MKYIKPESHMTQQTLHEFAAGLLSPEDTLAAADHISSCPVCTRALSEIAGAHPAEVPAGFGEEIEIRIAREKKKRSELLHFSFRVAIAACAAFFFIFGGALSAAAGPKEPLSGIQAPGFSVVDNLSAHLQDFSWKILDLEAFNHAETEK